VAAPSRERGWDGVRGAGQTQRGESGDTTPWSFERELEDVTALAAAAAPDGPVTLVGSSFGGLLAMGAAERVEVDRLVLYEPPMPAATVALVNRWGVPTAVFSNQLKNTFASQAGSIGVHGFDFRQWGTQFGRTDHRMVLTTPETMRSV
jgi:alpha-beta hydrolase superfamily lysophospholipase